ncbi:DUF3143 domain-containing protein [Oxynema sp. CENA135]|uniref:DUF3143 domain-containing protein n=1 Tax=Oxynema sp. CENA135 TaxID=984206 RepID=UPI00190BC57A|nr:DUF3143 domain-containing protein [Oxynema sp. CENA135]MBK4728842.1 DUF3143 domain-containing protein [Oxynema sp. CENA135]
MTLPSSDTPLYNHPLPEIEQWLKNCGCQQDDTELHRWYVEQPQWKAELSLDIDRLIVRYLSAGTTGEDIERAFKYSLSREDIEQAIFAGP